MNQSDIANYCIEQLKEAGAHKGAGLFRWECPLLHPVVRAFLGDDHVVDVTFFETRRGDANEA